MTKFETGNKKDKTATNKQDILIVKIKDLISLMVSSDAEISNINFSSHLSKEMGYNYTYLTNIFSELLGITIKQYIINQKIERIKNMIARDEMSLKQIASSLQYKRVSHFSNQFKKITGITPSHFKKIAVTNKLQANQ
ncbi:MAG: helix-turn-helix transcriptional regulator [Chitinophagaceae bacterium]|nr:helix-turn-helix transcriptional regulator [Chitinophagaceae bacterium]HEV8083076.1 AraC family transcriptional regulator [Chitinophagaceae bacterium]